MTIYEVIKSVQIEIENTKRMIEFLKVPPKHYAVDFMNDYTNGKLEVYIWHLGILKSIKEDLEKIKNDTNPA